MSNVLVIIMINKKDGGNVHVMDMFMTYIVVTVSWL